MKSLTALLLAAVLAAGILTACSQKGAAASSPAPAPQPTSSVQTAPPAQTAPAGQPAPASGEISGDEALAIALANASVPEADAYNVKVERDGDNGIPIWDIEFETEYGDYDFEVAISGGRIVGADYEVDDEWLDRLSRHTGSPLTAEEAKALLAGKAPGASAGDIALREERSDGRTRYEGEFYGDGIKYEFELDAATGVIYDWNADLRE